MLKRYLGILLCCIASPLSGQEPPGSITIVTGETPPYTSQNMKHQGYLNHVISKSFRKAGVETEFVFMPWSRAYLEAKQGDFIATSYWFADPRHEEHFYYSAPLGKENIVFFKRKLALSGDWNNFYDIQQKGLKLGLTRGYTYTRGVWEYANTRPDLVSIVNTDLQNLKMLMLKRIEAFPIEEVTGWYILNKHFPREQVQQIEIADEPLTTKTAHLFFSKNAKDSEKYLSLFNQGLTALQTSGELEAMYEALVLGEYH